MAIIIKGSINNSEIPTQQPKPVQAVQPVTFSEIVNRREPQAEKRTAPKTKPESSSKTDGGLIKPKYMKDESVFYKSSGYLSLS